MFGSFLTSSLVSVVLAKQHLVADLVAESSSHVFITNTILQHTDLYKLFK